MADLQQGGNASLNGSNVTVGLGWTVAAGVDADASAYLLTESGKVRGDADMIFYNQPEGGDGAIRFVAAAGGLQGSFDVDLTRLPAAITRIVFCVTIHEAQARRQTLGLLSSARIGVGPRGGSPDIAYAPALSGASEAAMTFGELYLRNGQWKFRAVGQGFNGGLAPLARSFGIDVAEEEPAAAASPAPTDRLVSLEKRVEREAPRLVNLAKTAAVSLRKNRLSDVRAQVALVLDRSGSMWPQYQRGRVQEILDRIVPLAAHFDDDGSLDIWAFGSSVQPLKPVTLPTVENYIKLEAGGWEKWKVGYGNDEPKVIKAVTDRFAKASPPAYVLFVSDGGVGQNAKIEKLLREAANKPIFWQFLGIGGSHYGILEHLDTMSGRRVDNCNFFALDDLHDISESDLYDRLLGEFPNWLTEARTAGIIHE